MLLNYIQLWNFFNNIDFKNYLSTREEEKSFIEKSFAERVPWSTTHRRVSVFFFLVTERNCRKQIGAKINAENSESSNG
jgi:hypothetical protein